MVCPHVREIIHTQKLVGYLLVQPDKPWYKYYLSTEIKHRERLTEKIIEKSEVLT